MGNKNKKNVAKKTSDTTSKQTEKPNFDHQETAKKLIIHFAIFMSAIFVFYTFYVELSPIIMERFFSE